eukprot:5984578-Amphidinium_carterae.1
MAMDFDSLKTSIDLMPGQRAFDIYGLSFRTSWTTRPRVLLLRLTGPPWCASHSSRDLSQTTDRSQWGPYCPGFRRGYGVDHAVSRITLVAERARQWAKPLIALVLDISKAYDFADRAYCIQGLLELGFSPRQAYALALLWPTNTRLTWSDLSRECCITSGLPQGDVLSPALFNVILWRALRNRVPDWHDRGLSWQLDTVFEVLIAYADDILLITDSFTKLTVLVEELLLALNTAHLTLEFSKLRPAANRFERIRHWTFRDHTLVADASVKYLGVCVNLDGDSEPLLLGAFTRAWQSFHAVAPLVKGKQYSLKLRLKYLDKTVGRSLQHGLAHVVWCSGVARRIDACQNAMYAVCMGLKRNPTAVTWVRHHIFRLRSAM